VESDTTSGTCGTRAERNKQEEMNLKLQLPPIIHFFTPHFISFNFGSLAMIGDIYGSASAATTRLVREHRAHCTLREDEESS
jgi:hypothetical protein